jgi:hypothetical protein
MTSHVMTLALAALVSSVNAFSCLDAKGNAVDYWVALKHNDGLDYSVFDADAQAFSVSCSQSANIMRMIKRKSQFSNSCAGRSSV